MPVLRSARTLAEAPITIVKKNPIDAKVKSLQDQLAAAHAQNERDGNEMKSLRAEVAKHKRNAAEAARQHAFAMRSRCVRDAHGGGADGSPRAGAAGGLHVVRHAR